MASDLEAVRASKTTRILFLVGVFISNIIMMSDYFVYPTLNLLYEMFPEGSFWVNFFVSGPFLVAAVLSPIVGKLCDRYSKKMLMVVGGFLAAIPAAFFLAIEDIMFMCAMKFIYSIGYAIIQVTAVAFIAEIYEDENRRATIMGYFNASITAFGVVISSAAGYMSAVSMQFAYRGYLVFIPIAVLFIFLLPSIKPKKSTETATAAATGETAGKKGKLGANYWMLVVSFAVFCLTVMMMYYFNAVYVAEHGFGDTIFVGNLNSTRIGCCFVIGLVFGVLLKKLGRLLPAIAYTGATISLAVMFLFPNLIVSCVFFVILGICFTTVYVYTYTMAPIIAGKGRENDAIAMLVTLFSLACFFPTYAVTFIEDLLGTTSFTPVMGVMAVIAAICTVAFYFVAFRLKKTEEAEHIKPATVSE